MNTYLKYQPPAMQFFAFLGLAFGLFILNGLLTTSFFSDINAVLLNKDAPVADAMIPQFKLAQLIGAILSFIVPGLLFGYFSSPKSLPYVGIQNTVSPVLLLICVLIFLGIQPFVMWLGNVNEKMNFGSMQASLVAEEAQYTRVLEIFLKMKNGSALLINLLIMALLPAIGEELFFRGAFQKVLTRLTNIPWLAIGISATIFTIMHGTVFKFLPIFSLGILLGTVYHFTRNLWYTILIHFINNAIGITAVYFAERSSVIKKFASDEVNVSILMAIPSILIVVALLSFLKKKSADTISEEEENHNDYLAS
jgi:membrane protease YdiL (CAAX protease family)